jgi:hypothetical protein
MDITLDIERFDYLRLKQAFLSRCRINDRLPFRAVTPNYHLDNPKFKASSQTALCGDLHNERCFLGDHVVCR